MNVKLASHTTYDTFRVVGNYVGLDEVLAIMLEAHKARLQGDWSNLNVVVVENYGVQEMEVRGWRGESDAERKDRLLHEVVEKEAKERDELAEFERLKKKFER